MGKNYKESKAENEEILSVSPMMKKQRKYLQVDPKDQFFHGEMHHMKKRLC